MIWFLLGIIVFTLLLNKISLKYGFERLDYRMEIGKSMVEIGEDIPFTCTLENPKPLTISFLKVIEKFPSGLAADENIYSIFMMPYQRIKRTYNVKAVERGLHRVTDVELILGDFIGFDNAIQNLKIDNKITILPEKIDLAKKISPVGDLYGDTSVRRWIVDDPLMTVGIREYTDGDPQKHIHWTSSMRYGKLMGKAHKDRFLEVLGKINYAVSSSLEDTLSNLSRRKGNYSTVVVITPKLLESYISPLNKLSKVITKMFVISMDDENLKNLNYDILKYRGDRND